ncbi:MAG: tetratricopeptide repeat protein [Deltaproteobacteria bacterium]|jgi:tetratricopeptide (TPR) repeat protein
MMRANLKKGLFVCCLMALVLTASLSEAVDPIGRGMQSYNNHHYEDAAATLLAHLSVVEAGQQGKLNLGLGMTFLACAQVYQELHRTALSVQVDYLGKLLTSDQKDGSHYAKLYLGRSLLDSGKPAEASVLLRECIRDKKIEPRDRSLAQIALARACYLQGRYKEAAELWSTADTKDPEVLSELAAAYSRLGLAEKKPLAMCDQVGQLLKQTQQHGSIRLANNLITVYAREGQIDKGLHLIKSTELSGFFHEETLGKNKSVRFYEPSLLDNLAVLYGRASLEYLEKAATDEKIKGVAQYYLAEAEARFGTVAQSIKILDEALTSGLLPSSYREKAELFCTVARFRQNSGPQSQIHWVNATWQQKGPQVLADTLLLCNRLDLECSAIAKKATTLVGAMDGKRSARLNYALGRYYLRKGKYQRAIACMETVRDKSNKNKIEQNDPLMLINLAEAYYRSKKFSEALEIYFGMGKQFPALRQIQVFMQGVYAMEQKSAGDARLY